MTWRPEVVVRVEAIWKMKMAFESPWASRVRSPDEISSEEVDLYRPGVRVRPPKFPAIVTAPSVLPAASSYAVVKSNSAWAAAESPACIAPLSVPGPKPVTAVPGLTPRFPLTTVTPVLVTAEPARTANPPDDPSTTPAWPVVAVAVVKLHTALLASPLPARSFAPVVIVAVYTVFRARGVVGAKAVILLVTSYPTTPATGAPPRPVSVKVVVLIVDGFMASLKVAVIVWLAGTPVAELRGTVEVMVGA